MGAGLKQVPLKSVDIEGGSAHSQDSATSPSHLAAIVVSAPYRIFRDVDLKLQPPEFLSIFKRRKSGASDIALAKHPEG
jgi:hypothetical protein